MAYAAFFDSADMCETLMGYGHNFSILDALIRVELTELFVECSSILKDPDLVKRLTVPGSDISEADIKKLGDMLEVSNAGRGGGAGGGGGSAVGQAQRAQTSDGSGSVSNTPNSMLPHRDRSARALLSTST